MGTVRIRDTGPTQKDEIRRQLKREKAGVSSGIWGCIFAALGFFTFGGLFVPIAVLFSLSSLLDSLLALNFRGFLVSIVAWTLTVVAFIASPIAWVEASALIVWFVGK